MTDHPATTPNHCIGCPDRDACMAEDWENVSFPCLGLDTREPSLMEHLEATGLPILIFDEE